MRNEYVEKWHAENDPRPGEEPLHDTVSYQGDSYDDTRPHLWKFFQAVKTRAPVAQDAVFGHHAALACHMANESYFQKRAVMFDPATDTVKS